MLYNGGEITTAQEGSWLMGFNHNIVETKNRKWIKTIDTQLTSPMRNVF